MASLDIVLPQVTAQLQEREADDPERQSLERAIARMQSETSAGWWIAVRELRSGLKQSIPRGTSHTNTWRQCTSDYLRRTDHTLAPGSSQVPLHLRQTGEAQCRETIEVLLCPCLIVIERPVQPLIHPAKRIPLR
jgi:hypothetical protein